MIDRITAFAPLALMALLAGLTYWISQIAQTDDTRKAERHDPDYIITNFNVRRFDPNGALQHTLIADRMEHYPDDDTSVVTKPRLINHRQPITEISARLALVAKQSEQIEFVDDVRVVRQGDAKSPLPTVMTSRLLTVFPDDERGHTLTPVTITRGNSVVRGSRLDLDNKTGIAVLRGRVTGTLYNPRTPPP